MNHPLVQYVTQNAPHAPIGVLLLSPSLHVVHANELARTLLGVAEGQVPDCEADLEGLMQGREAVSQQVAWRCAGKPSVEVNCSFIPLRDAQEKPEGLLVLAQSALQARAQEHTLLQAERFVALDLVVRGFAHELNNPLTVILGFAELLLKKPLDPDVRARVAIISEKADRCRKIVENLSSFSQANRSPVSEVQVNEVLEDILTLCAYQLTMDHIEVVTELEADLPPVRVQKQELQGVFLSLVSNAHLALAKLKEMPRRLRVKSWREANSILISFSDNGLGIPPEVQHRVFDPFFSTRGVGEGMGLGLSVAYGVVRENGGRIWLDHSSADGTTMVVELPLAPSAV